MSLKYEPVLEGENVGILNKGYTANDWNFQAIRKHEKDGGHNCYGTTTKDASSYFLIDVSDKHCNNVNLKVPCAIEVDLVHSWDSTYISDSTCTLYALKEINARLDSTNEIHTISITHNECLVDATSSRDGLGTRKKKSSQKRKVEGTFPCTHTIPVTIAAPQVVLKCTNLASSKLTCVSKVSLTYET